MGAGTTFLIDRRRHREECETASRAEASAKRLWAVDDQLFVAFQLLAGKVVDDDIAQTHVRATLQGIARFFGDDVIRGSVFLRDGGELVCWTHVGLDEPRSGFPRRYPIREYVREPRGVVVAAFMSRKIERCPMERESSGRWRGKHKDFITRGTDQFQPLYRDFVAIPLLLHDLPIGVMCLDSTTKGTFDLKKKGLRDELRRLEDRVTASLLIVRKDLAQYGTKPYDDVGTILPGGNVHEYPDNRGS